MCGWSTHRLCPDTQCSIEMLWVLLICFQMWLSVLTESCSFHLPLTAVSFGQPWWVSKGVVADCSWPEGLVCTKRGGVLCSSLGLLWALIERKEFCCKYQNLIFWGWGSEKGRGEQGKRQERKKEHVIGEHFSLGWSVWALPLGNYAVSWLKESALKQDFKTKAEASILLCRSLASHDNMCLTVIFKSLRNGTSAAERWDSSATPGAIVAQMLAYRRVQECWYSKYFSKSH